MLITKTANCGTLGDWAKKQGIWHTYKDTAKPGDVVLFDFSKEHDTRQHAGIVVSQTGDTLTTIEGNTSVTSNDNGGAVMRRTRYRSQVVGYVRPHYTSTQTAARLVQIATGQIGVKESPANSNNVKYNTWFYGRAVYGSEFPWCCVFVCWCFNVLGGKTVTITVNELQKGNKGNDVKTVQRLLNAMMDAKLEVDGDFGNNTRVAVKAFQKANALTCDGVVGEKTWDKLIN